jgi:hypothetical protein
MRNYLPVLIMGLAFFVLFKQKDVKEKPSQLAVQTSSIANVPDHIRKNLREIQKHQQVPTFSYASGKDLLIAILQSDSLKIKARKPSISEGELGVKLRRLKTQYEKDLVENSELIQFLGRKTIYKLEKIVLGQSPEEIDEILGTRFSEDFHILRRVLLVDAPTEMEKQIYRGTNNIAEIFFYFSPEKKLVEFYTFIDHPSPARWVVGSAPIRREPE